MAIACQPKYNYAQLATERCDCERPWAEFQLNMRIALKQMDTTMLNRLSAISETTEAQNNACRAAFLQQIETFSEKETQKLRKEMHKTCPEIAFMWKD